MDKLNNTAVKAGAGGVAGILVALSLILGSLGVTTDLAGSYVVTEQTQYTSTVFVENIEEVPDATFYEIVFTNDEGDYAIGKANFSTESDGGYGIIVPNIMLTDYDNLSVVIYDHNLEAIGVGNFKNDNSIEYKISKERVANVESETPNEQ